MIRFSEGTSQEHTKFVSQYSNLSTSNDNHFNMHQEIMLEIERQRKVKKRPRIGFITETVPTWRTYVNVPVHIAQTSDEDIRIFLRVMNGISPFDYDDQWSKKMFTWDIYMH